MKKKEQAQKHIYIYTSHTFTSRRRRNTVGEGIIIKNK